MALFDMAFQPHGPIPINPVGLPAAPLPNLEEFAGWHVAQVVAMRDYATCKVHHPFSNDVAAAQAAIDADQNPGRPGPVPLDDERRATRDRGAAGTS